MKLLYNLCLNRDSNRWQAVALHSAWYSIVLLKLHDECEEVFKSQVPLSVIFIAHICVCVIHKHSCRVTRPLLNSRIC